jgi:steroid delta-isomerase-like uncharacterized protein
MRDASTEERNKALIRRWFDEVWNQGRADLIDEFRASDAVAAGLEDSGTHSQGKGPFEAFHANLRGALPDLRVVVEEMIAEGDKVAIRIAVNGTHTGYAFGVRPTGKAVAFSGIIMANILNGKISQAWNSLDQLSLLRQIGALPAGTPPANFLVTRAKV